MVKPKKHLGQHFLRNDEICARVSDSISHSATKRQVLEIGPGTGALTKHLLKREDMLVDVVEVDRESVEYLKVHYPILKEVVGMFQKEVAERIAADSGGRDRGILSVLMQAFYTVEYLFTVDENEFFPPPKVKSGVIRILRNDVKSLPVDEKFFKTLVKTGFNQRRKTLRNSVKGVAGYHVDLPFMDKRPEQLSVNQWLELAAAFL
jgi:16S rRNA (adenine1518-N6/adenine1519-N6)-dimethyltransferase